MAQNHAKATKSGWKLTSDWMNIGAYVKPEPYVFDGFRQLAVIVDIDGTVAINDGHRGHYDYARVGDDKLHDQVAGLVAALSLDAQLDVKILFVSGREDSCREATSEWLDWYELPSKHLFMRKTGDHRPDYIIKREIFDEHIRDKYDVWFVLDDRTQVVEHCWRAMGLTCLQVAPGDF